MDAGISFTTVRHFLPTPLKQEALIVVQGHAGAMLQARQLGSELFVGIHSDESILENKGPTVMTLEER
jgi:hypothetical protein